MIQFQQQAGIFQCDAETIYSSQVIEIAPDTVTHAVDSDLKCESGGEFNTALNLPIFLAVWEKVVQEGTFGAYAWTTKVDADSVFFPDRLRYALQKYEKEEAFQKEDSLGVYLNNCQYGLHGPVEVFSRSAVKTWSEGTTRCLKHFYHLCDGDCNWGEDLFIDQCLWKVLGAKREDDWGLLVEDHCSPPENWENCKGSWHVAYHPFKTGYDWMQCFENALSVEG